MDILCVNLIGQYQFTPDGGWENSKWLPKIESLSNHKQSQW